MAPCAFAAPKSVRIAVGGKALYYYLPISIAERLGYFKDEGLDVEIIDFQGGSRSLQAVVGGSADVVSGAFEHTLAMQARGQAMQAFVLQGRALQCVFAVSRKTMPNFKSLADLKGKRIGVTAPGSSSHAIAIYILSSAGLKSNDVSYIDAVVRADRWLAKATAEDIVRTVPESYFLGNKEIYVAGFLKNRPALSKDGYIPEHAPEISFKSLQIVNAKLKNFKPDYAAVFTNKFVEAAHTKYPA